MVPTCRILPNEQYHWFCIEVGVIELRADEVMKIVSLFQGQQLPLVDLLQALGHGRVKLRLILFPAFKNPRHLANLFFVNFTLFLVPFRSKFGTYATS